jgi:hypothetical protein
MMVTGGRSDRSSAAMIRIGRLMTVPWITRSSAKSLQV